MTTLFVGLAATVVFVAFASGLVQVKQRALTPIDLMTGTGVPPLVGDPSSPGAFLSSIAAQSSARSSSNILGPRLAATPLQGAVIVVDAEPDRIAHVLNYTVECALDPVQSVNVSISSRSYTFQGAHGLAPQWQVRELDQDAQEMVSACIIARMTFWDEVGIPVSIRGNAPGLVPAGDEQLEFPVMEGAFWGNLFLQDPVAYTCSHKAALLNSYAHLRVCTTGVPVDYDGSTWSCGFVQSVGECNEHCDPYPTMAPTIYGTCLGNPHVITTYLANATKSP
ncbi:Uncharacterized protein PBTT_03306 [Plasmodiophora brassicae]